MPEGPRRWKSPITWQELFRDLYILLPITLFCTALVASLNGGSWSWTLISGIGMIILWAVGALFLYAIVHASYYVWFLFYRVWFVVFGAAGLSFILYRIYDYFDRLVPMSTGKDFVVSRGGDILIYLFGAALFVVVLLWGIRLLRLLSFQRPLDSAESEMTLEYVGSVPSSRSFRDLGNHVFRLCFSVKPFVDALPVFFVALERLDQGARTGIAWTSRKLAFVRPLGLSAEPTGSTRIHTKGRLRRCVMRDADSLYVFVFAKPGEDWFEAGAEFRAVAYVVGGGYVSASTSATQVSGSRSGEVSE